MIEARRRCSASGSRARKRFRGGAAGGGLFRIGRLCQSILRGRTTDGKGLARRGSADVERVMGSREGKKSPARQMAPPATWRGTGASRRTRSVGRSEFRNDTRKSLPLVRLL